MYLSPLFTGSVPPWDRLVKLTGDAPPDRRYQNRVAARPTATTVTAAAIKVNFLRYQRPPRASVSGPGGGCHGGETGAAGTADTGDGVSGPVAGAIETGAAGTAETGTDARAETAGVVAGVAAGVAAGVVAGIGSSASAP